MERQKTVAVALAGGGVIGYFFEAGSIRAMRDCDLPISKFSGVSAGAAVAALAAHDLLPDEYDPFENIRINYLKDVSKLSLIPYGLFGIRLMLASTRHKESSYDYCFNAPKELVDLGTFENFFAQILLGEPKDLYITATNVDTGQLRVFTKEDNIARAIRASCSFPGIGKPTLIDGCYYVDGIVSCSANVEVLGGSDLVICVNPITFNCMESGFVYERGMFKIFDQSFRILNRSRLTADIEKFMGRNGNNLILIEPNGCEIMARNPMRRDMKTEAMQSGYDYTMSILTENAEIFHKLGIQFNRPEIRRVFSEGQ